MWLSLIADIIGGPGPADGRPASDCRGGRPWEELLAACLPEGYEAARLLAEAESRCFWPPFQPAGRPRLINVCGLPGSGKTCELNRLAPQYPDYFRLAFDETMEGLEGYQRDYQKSRAGAFQRWERPARVLGYYFLSRAVADRRSILFEHGNTAVQHLGLYKIIKNSGYYLQIRRLKSSPELVGPRLAGRPRYFPESELENRWRAFKRLLPAYRALAHEFIELEG